jgi:nucleoside-diphosphate-sugar epimerase
VYGRTQDLPPPRTAGDPVAPIEHYARHKMECEALVRASGLAWTIFRLAAALPLALRPDPGMYDVPLDNRIEFVHTRDAGLAVANGVSSDAARGRLLLVGGGPRCQYRYRQLVETNLEAMGIGMLPEAAFSSVPFPTDWLDTAESQALLRYQRHDLDDYAAEMRARLGLRRHAVRLIRPLARRWLLSKSPYYPRSRGWHILSGGAGRAPITHERGHGHGISNAR